MTDQKGNKGTKKKESGSPSTGEPLSIAVGRIRRPHGIKGEVIFEPYPEYSFDIAKGRVILIGDGKEAYSLRSVRGMDRNFLLSFDGLEDCDAVGHLRNQTVYIRRSELKEREGGGNYPHEVLGMTVVGEDGTVVGTLREVLLTGANDVYVIVNPEEEEILLPAIDDVILNVDAGKRTITVRLPVWE